MYVKQMYSPEFSFNYFYIPFCSQALLYAAYDALFLERDKKEAETYMSGYKLKR
ncbi:hypothetical protein VEZ01S_49_00230 [Vibrio ezurae NBRC 102218]|uniref:Uncharacterized protein n=1 Tax=Vibrio ezurae NBRC 102218 TaxID=1219080 RepID=U3B551_9VIBR|nr:hypothetical protein VEZ01S_49_00230 [Vibrio ezurae NBRC 102218]